MNIRKIEQDLNDYIVQNDLDDSPILVNLEIFHILSELLEDTLYDIEDSVYEIDYTRLSRKTPFENIELIKRFYKDNNIVFDIDKYINDGTIDLRYFDKFNDKDIDEDDKVYNLVYGNQKLKNNFKTIEAPNNGFVTDSAIMVHELSHLHNNLYDDEAWTRCLLTEPLAFAEEFIYLDYLEDLGYVYESRKIKGIDYASAFYLSGKTSKLFKILIVYNEMGSLSKDSYQMLYNDDEYDVCLNILYKFLYENNMGLVHFCNYILGYTLGVYMYNYYRKDKKIMDNIQSLHEMINEKDFIPCLNEIGLNSLDDDDINLIRESLLDINKQLSNNKTRK